jgi:hypothetical protein
MPSANIILILDKSTSMSIDEYFSSARTDCSTFVNIMKINDKLGLVTLSTSSQIIFPTSGNQMVAITGLPVQNQAVQAVVGTAMAGSTNMTDAIGVSHSMIASAATPRAIILLSDGEYNTGGNPLTNLPTDVPIYTIALGPSSGLQTLQTIANRTVGSGLGYYYAPDGWDLAAIYNTIAPSIQVRNLASNTQPLLSNYTFNSFPVTVPSGNTQACFAVNWTNPAVTYTPGTPSGQQISVSLKDPNGNVVTPATVATGLGFVVLTVNNPVAGQWQVGTWTASTGNLQTTVAGFDSNTQLTLDMKFDTAKLKVGAPVPLVANIHYDGQPIKGAIVTAIGDSPLVSNQQALADHKTALSKLKVPKSREQAPSDLLRLRMLRERNLSKGDILQRAKYPISISASDSGEQHGSVTMTDTPGSHTVEVSVTGRSPVDDTPFSRVTRLSVHLE